MSPASLHAIKGLMKKMTPATIDAFYARLAALNPEPKGELEYVNAYTLLIAVVLSAQATDVGVNKATRALFAKVKTPEQMVALGEAGLKNHIKTIGLFNTKAKNVIGLSQMLIEEHESQVPADRDALQRLPGVGRKTANVVLNIFFGQPTIAVDTHIFRISNRTGLAPGRDVAAVEAALEARTPDKWKRHAHHWLILHGRYVCKARKPDCGMCAVFDLCLFADKTDPAAPPKVKAKEKSLAKKKVTMKNTPKLKRAKNPAPKNKTKKKIKKT